MATDKLPVVRLCDLTPGELVDTFAMLSEKSRQLTRDGKPYYTCRFRDRKTSFSAVVWADSPLFADCESDWHPGRFFKLRCTLVEHEKYGPQLALGPVRYAIEGECDPYDLMPGSRFSPDEMFPELRALVETELADEPLRRLVLLILDQQAAKLRLLPASPRHYYPFPGGWLEHTLSVSRNCLLIADRYRERNPELQPPLNRDLLLAGAVLHDIGRVVEIDDPLNGTRSVVGELMGHLVLGRDLVREAAREVPELDGELLMLLDHLIYAHLKLPEWGSPRLPAIPEVLILHHLDDLDAKLEMYLRCLTTDTSAGPFTDRDPVLNRALLKSRKA